MASTRDEPEIVTAEGLDLSVINKLAKNLNSRLQGGLHGEFYEGGSRAGEAIRQAQLPLVFKLTEAIDSLKAEIQKKSAIANADENKLSKTAAKMSGNSIKAMEAVAERMMADKLRDQNIKIERLEAQNKKQQEKIDTLEAEVKPLKLKNKKGDHQGQAPKAVEAKVNALEFKMAFLEQNVTQAEFKRLSLTVDKIHLSYVNSFTFQPVKDRVAALQARAHKTDSVVGTLRADMEMVKTALEKDTELSSTNEERTATAVGGLNTHDGNNEIKLRRHQDWLTEHNKILARHNETIKSLEEQLR